MRIEAVKLTVVGVKAPAPSTGVPKFDPLAKSAAGGVKLSACCVSGKTKAHCVLVAQVFWSTGVKKIRRRVEDDAAIRQTLRDSETRGKIVGVRVHQSGGIALLASDKNEGTPFWKIRLVLVLCLS